MQAAAVQTLSSKRVRMPAYVGIVGIVAISGSVVVMQPADSSSLMEQASC